MPTIKILLLITAFILSFNAYAQNDEFPGRAKYPSIPLISISDLQKIKDEVIIVDVRSNYEHQTLRIKNALNIPLSSKTYIDEMNKLRTANKDKKIIVYCNGKTCMKSYKAALKCRKLELRM